MGFDYYYGEEAEQFSFIRIPKLMLIDERFAALSLSAKILYGVLLDRMALSVKNKWLDEEQRVYIIFKIEEIQEMLGFSKKKSIDYLNELEEFGLVEKRRRGLGLPSILYIKSFMSGDSAEKGTSRGAEIDTSVQEKTDENDVIKADDESQVTVTNIEKASKMADYSKKDKNPVQKSCVRSADLGTSRGSQIALQEVPETTLQEVHISTPLNNNTNINNTYRSNIKSNLIPSGKMGLDEMKAYAEIIKENIEYDFLLATNPNDADLIRGIYDLILETVLSKNEYTNIASNTYPTELVKSKLLKLDSSHILYVLECLGKNTTKVNNIKKYMLAALFNATSTIDGYYQAEAKHDMYG